MVSVHPDENTEPNVQHRVYRGASIVNLIEEPDTSYHLNPEAYFISIYNEFYSYAFSLAKMFVGAEDAVDIVAVVFGRLWGRKDSLEKIVNIKGYIAASIRNACKDHLEDISQRRKKDLDWSYCFSGVSENEYEIQEIHAEKMQRIYNEVEKLPKRCREIFELAFFEGLKNSEIARRLGVSSRNVLNQKSFALKTIRLRILSVVLFLLLHVFP